MAATRGPYLIKTTSGDRGPYTAAQIAALVKDGKLKPAIRVIDQASKQPIAAGDVVKIAGQSADEHSAAAALAGVAAGADDIVAEAPVAVAPSTIAPGVGTAANRRPTQPVSSRTERPSAGGKPQTRRVSRTETAPPSGSQRRAARGRDDDEAEDRGSRRGRGRGPTKKGGPSMLTWIIIGTCALAVVPLIIFLTRPTMRDGYDKAWKETWVEVTKKLPPGVFEFTQAQHQVIFNQTYKNPPAKPDDCFKAYGEAMNKAIAESGQFEQAFREARIQIEVDGKMWPPEAPAPAPTPDKGKTPDAGKTPETPAAGGAPAPEAAPATPEALP